MKDLVKYSDILCRLKNKLKDKLKTNLKVLFFIKLKIKVRENIKMISRKLMTCIDSRHHDVVHLVFGMPSAHSVLDSSLTHFHFAARSSVVDCPGD